MGRLGVHLIRGYGVGAVAAIALLLAGEVWLALAMLWIGGAAATLGVAAASWLMRPRPRRPQARDEDLETGESARLAGSRRRSSAKLH